MALGKRCNTRDLLTPCPHPYYPPSGNVGGSKGTKEEVKALIAAKKAKEAERKEKEAARSTRRPGPVASAKADSALAEDKGHQHPRSGKPRSQTTGNPEEKGTPGGASEIPGGGGVPGEAQGFDLFSNVPEDEPEAPQAKVYSVSRVVFNVRPCLNRERSVETI